MLSPLQRRQGQRDCTKLHFHCLSSAKDLHVTYHVSLLPVQFLIGHFSSQHDTLSDGWSSLRVSRYHFFFFFLDIFPLLFTKYFFFIPLLLSMALGQPNLGRIFFSTFGFHLKALSYELLAIQSLDLHINNGFRWHLFDNGFSLPMPLFPLSPYLSLSTTPVCLCCIPIMPFLFLRFCVSVQMYEMCPSAVWPCRCGREPVNEMSRSPFSSNLFHGSKL